MRYARGELAEDQLETERDRMFGEIEGLNEELFGEGIAFADNMLEIARDAKAYIEHGAALDRVEDALRAVELRER